jgi:protein involved in polysaccharide export with SLBB domain
MPAMLIARVLHAAVAVSFATTVASQPAPLDGGARLGNAAVDSSGDYVRVGDKIALWVAGYPALTDTFTVAEGLKLRLPEQLPDLTLSNVRRSDVEKVVTDHIGKYIKEPQVRASVLLEIAVSGAVGKPGYVTVSPDALLRDAITHAGGYSQTASLNKVSIRRDAKEWMKPDATRKALEAGRTLTSLQLRSGDEIVVGEDKGQRMQITFQIAALLTGLLGLYAAFR